MNLKIHLAIEKCSNCNTSPVVKRKYSEQKLCISCFNESVENQVLKTIKNYNLFKPREKIIVGLSGGKDSITLLYNLKKIIKTTSYSNEIAALLIDEGIKDYRDKSIVSAKNFCENHQITYKIVRFKEKIGKTLDEIIKGKKESKNYRYACNYCAAFRRRLLNEGAKALGGDVLAVGHNLTDIAETYLMNILYNRFSLIGRKRFKRKQSSKRTSCYIKKVKPLMKIPEEEIFLYLNTKELSYYPSNCPYSLEDPILRRKVFEFIQQCKEEIWNLEFNLLNEYINLSEIIRNQTKNNRTYNHCKKCEYPCTNNQICTYCRYINEIEKI